MAASNGTARAGSHLQAAGSQPVPGQSDDKASAIAELQAFRPLPAPWQIRYRKHIVAGVAVAAIVGLPALGAYLWRSLGPSRLDEVGILVPAQNNTEGQNATPAPLRAVAPPQKRSDPVATSSRSQPVSGAIENRAPRRDSGDGPRSAITHTKGAAPVAGRSANADPSQQQPRVQDQRPASQIECSEAVVALGLCASNPSTKAAQ
jgi:hypothetical protein